MKNFTKTITNKTLFKTTRWLIMALMLLLGTSNAWGANNATKSDGSYRFYFQFNGGSTWWNASGCNHYAWVWANGAGGQIQRIYKLGTTSNASTGNQSDVFYMNIPNNMVLHGMILFRGNPSETNPTNGSTSFPADGTYYNKTNDIILSNDISSKNYITAVSEGSSTVTYSTYTTVSVATTSLTASNAKSGSGTQADPYVFDENTTMKLSASATIDDHNFQIQLAYGSSTSMKTSGSSQSIDVALTTAATATAYNVTYTPCLGGSTSYKGTASTKTIYYKTEKSCETVSASQYTIDDTEYTWDGSAKTPTVTANTGAGDPTSTVYKQGETTVASPINVGTYDVYVTSGDGTTYCGATNLKVGSFEIQCKTGNASDLYTLTKASEEYVGAPRGTGATPVTGAGTATIIYKQGENTVSPINVGIYDVYITSEAGTGYCAITKPTKIGTFEVTCKTATASQYTISQTSYPYDGSAKKPTVSKASGAGAAGEVTSTDYKQGDTTVDNPINAGTYDIYITTEAGTGYCALTNFKLGSFTIEGKDPIESDFTYTNSKDYTGSALSADVAWKTGLAAGVGGAITTYYKVEGAADNTYTTTAPTAVGTYTVAVTTAAGGNYAAATQKIVLGEFTINEVCEPISDLTWTITSGAKTTYCPGDKVTVTMTYNGTTAKDYDWGGDYDGNIGILGGSIASGAQYTMTINKSGSVNLTLTDCKGNEVTTTPTLEFTTHDTPATPTITFSANPVGQSKETILSIASYNANNNYIVYRSTDNAVGNDTEVGTYTAPMSIRHDDTGSYYYYAKATNKSCANLTATSEIVKLDVQEAGAIIAALGDLKVDPQDPVDFVAMYVKNDGLSDFTDQGATKVTGYTWQFSNDGGNTWNDCASTNAVAGATYSIIGMENGSSKCNNFRPNAVGKYRCKVTYNEGEQTSNVLTVTGDGITARTFKDVTMNIPVISVNTGKEKFPTCDGLSGTASKNADVIKEKISVDVKIFAKVGNNIEVVYDRKARMNYRGSSSLNFVKKSYAFCTAKEKTKNDKGAVDTGKENLFGLSNGAKDKDWVLYAAAADPSIMRNRLMFDTFRDMTGGWSVGSKYVELVVNGEYKGVYVLMDKITANEKRVNVAWEQDINGNTTQEGFIVKFDKTDIVDRYENTSGDQKTFKSTYSGHDGFTTYDTQIDQRFEIEYPEKEDIEEEDLENNKGAGEWSEVFNTIKEKFNKFEYELAKGNFTEVQKLIDYTSWADWFIITEFGKNIDGYRASNLFVYDGSKANAKIEARPLWDQELSFDNQCPNYYANYGANNASGFMIDKSNDAAYNNDASTPFWFTGRYTGGRGTYNGSNQTFKGLLDDPCFVAMVKTRWAKHKADALSQDKLNAKVTAYTTEMGAAKDREASFWSTRSRSTCQCSYSGSTGYVNVPFTDSKNAITNWIKNRPAGLNTAIEALKGLDLTISLTVTPDGGETTPWEAVMVEVNNPSGYDYDLEYTTNTLDKVEGVIINENNDKYTYRIPRPSTWGTGDGERDAIEYGIQAILNVADDNLQCGTINEELTKADVTITLKDEEDDNCSIK